MNEKSSQSHPEDIIRRYQAFMDITNDGFGVVDERKILLYVNKRFCNILGYSPEEMVGKSLMSFVDEENRIILEKNIGKREKGMASDYELSWLTKDGSPKATIVSGSPIIDDSGNHKGSFAIITDISVIKDAQDALERSEARYRKVVESMDEGLITVNANWKITYANPSFERMLGYSMDEVVGKDFQELIVDELKSGVERWRKERQSGVIRGYEVEWKAKDGRSVYTYTTPRGLYDQNEQLYGFIGVLVDITERRKSEQALAESEKRYRTLFQETPMGILTCRPDGTITDVNARALEILGSPSEEHTKEINLLEYQPLIDSGISEDIRLCIENRSIISGGAPYVSKWGKEIHFKYKILPMETSEKKIEYVIVAFEDISDSLKAEEARKQSEENYRTLAEKSLQGLTVIQDEKYTYVNPAFASIVGYTPGEILAMESQTQWNLIYPDDKKYLLDLAKRRNAGEHVPTPYEYRLVKRDGTVRWVEAFSSKILFGGREALQVHVIDITDRKIAQMELKTSQDMLQIVLKHIPQHIFWKDTALIYLGCNENFARVSGAGTPENIIGKSDFDLAWRREEAERFREIDRRVIETGTPEYDRVDKQLQADGNDAWLRTTIIPLLDDKGKIVGIMGTQEDVTEKLEAERSIRRSEAKYRALAEQSLQGLTVVSDEGFLYVNKAFANMVGRTIENLLGLKGDSVWDLLHPEDRDILRERIEAMRSRKPVGPRHEYRFVRSDGATRWMEAYAQVIDYQGVSAIQTVWVDITERRRAEKDVRTEKDRATLYLDLMGHDIRQQLQVIMNSATLLRTATEEDVRTSFFGIIEEAVQRCSRLIEEVRATENLLAIPLVQKSLAKSLIGVKQALENRSANTAFHTEIQKPDAQILADDYLELLITNILINAIEHNNKQSKNVWISLREEDNGYVVSIADDGPGIGDKRKKELFDMARRYGGVGLHQSTQIVEKYGGRITVADRVKGRPSEGADFRIWLPKPV
ncbi:MAG: PAS domain S-box protein [Candidatus Thorarchaeota archaeon]